jgi:AraC-like DNA-binding protein
MSVRQHDDGVDRWCFTAGAAAPALAGAVRGYTHYTEQTSSFITRRELPGTEGVLIINLGARLDLVGGDGAALTLKAGEGFVAGLHLSPALSRSHGGQGCGVHVFLPLPTLSRLLHVNMAELVDRVVDLRALFGPAATTLGEQLADATPAQAFDMLDAALVPRLAAARAPDRATAWALARLHADPSETVERLAADIGWSRKHLATRMRRDVGVTPRTYARLRRFERLVANLTHGTQPHWADLAAAHGFADQPHMIREMRDLSGLTPTSLMERLLPDGGGLVDT